MVVSNTSYDLAKQLTKSLQLLWNKYVEDKYVEDTQRDSDEKSTTFWQSMNADKSSPSSLTIFEYLLYFL